MSNCKKCGKEIEKGDLCDECKKSKGKIKIIANVIEIAIIVIVLFGFLAANVGFIADTPVGKIFSFMKIKSSRVGNTAANIQNYGYAVEGDNYIFYSLPNEKAEYMNIYRMDKDGENRTMICSREWNVTSLNCLNNKLYFIGYDKDDDGENRAMIYRMDIDGENIKELTSDVNSSSNAITINDNQIYYLNDEFQICKVSINGGESKIVSEMSNGYVSVVGDWIYYVDYDSENYAMCKMKLDGSDAQQLTGDVMYDLNIVGDDLYYVNGEGKFCKKNKDGDEEVIYESEIYNVNIKNGIAYFMKYVETEDSENIEDGIVGLYSMKIDGTEEKLLKKFKSYSSFINVVGDWIMYSDQDNENGYMGMQKIDGSQEINLYEINFSNMAGYSEQSIDDGNVEIVENPIVDENDGEIKNEEEAKIDDANTEEAE